MVGWRVNVVVRIIVRHQAKEALDIRRLDCKKLLPSEDGLVVEGHAESVLKLHQTTNVGVVDLLVRHDPAVGVMVLGLSIIRKRNIKKKRIVRKEYGNN